MFSSGFGSKPLTLPEIIENILADYEATKLLYEEVLKEYAKLRARLRQLKKGTDSLDLARLKQKHPYAGDNDNIRLIENKFNQIDFYLKSYRKEERLFKKQNQPLLLNKYLHPTLNQHEIYLIQRCPATFRYYMTKAQDCFRIANNYFRKGENELKMYQQIVEHIIFTEQRAEQERQGILDGSRVVYTGVIGHFDY